MKLKYIFIAAAALVLGSCTKSAIAPLEGVYQRPDDFNSTELVSSSIDKLDGVRCFNVELEDAGARLSLKFYCDKYYLEPVTYSSADAASIRKGFYLVGEGGSTYTKNGKTTALDHGGISVSANGSDYSFSGSVWLADGNVVKINSKVTIVYEPDPEPVKLSTVLSASSNLANGTPSVSLNLAQAGISSVQNPDWSTTWTGEGHYLAIDLYSADGYLHEGTYTPSAAGGQVTEGTFGIGWDPGDIFGWGVLFTDWGTCWWNVSGGVAKSEKKITEGTVTVSRNGNKWTIELVSGEGKDMVWGLFEGEVPASQIRILPVRSNTKNLPRSFRQTTRMPALLPSSSLLMEFHLHLIRLRGQQHIQAPVITLPSIFIVPMVSLLPGHTMHVQQAVP